MHRGRRAHRRARASTRRETPCRDRRRRVADRHGVRKPWNLRIIIAAMRFTHLLSLGAAAMLAAGSLTSAQSSSSRLLVLNKDNADMAIVDPGSGKVLGRVPVGQGPHELVTSTDGKIAYASNYGTGPAPGHTISMIDIAAQKELRRIDVAPLSRPHGLEFANGKLYFTAEAHKKIPRHDPAADRTDRQVADGAQPQRRGPPPQG